MSILISYFFVLIFLKLIILISGSKSIFNVNSNGSFFLYLVTSTFGCLIGFNFFCSSNFLILSLAIFHSTNINTKVYDGSWSEWGMKKLPINK